MDCDQLQKYGIREQKKRPFFGHFFVNFSFFTMPDRKKNLVFLFFSCTKKTRINFQKCSKWNKNLWFWFWLFFSHLWDMTERNENLCVYCFIISWKRSLFLHTSRASPCKWTFPCIKRWFNLLTFQPMHFIHFACNSWPNRVNPSMPTED